MDLVGLQRVVGFNLGDNVALVDEVIVFGNLGIERCRPEKHQTGFGYTNQQHRDTAFGCQRDHCFNIVARDVSTETAQHVITAVAE